MGFELTVLGNSSATPVYNRNLSAQVLKVLEHFFLIDCGEGTQTQLRKFNISINKINNVFISHLHGDHYLGLLGLISTMHLFNRDKELHIFAHPDLEKIINIYLQCSNTVLCYPLVFHSLTYDKSEKIYEDKNITVNTIVLDHRIECCGFVFKEKEKPRKINKEITDKYNIPVYELNNLKKGSDYTDKKGNIIRNSELTFAPSKPSSYAYCSDTKYCESIIPLIKNVDMLYHETTFMSEKQDIAVEKFHSTTIDAADIAKKAQVKKLIIGHFSARYKELEPLLNEAKNIFKNTAIAEEGVTYNIS
ncbi:MAG: ribonuclease Z [Bacteroidales bacterium]|nr:ribonuclease Z [Bacteroidales bacterium]